LHQLQQNASCYRLLRRGQLAEFRFGAPGNGACHTTDVAIRCDGQLPAPTPFPQLAQGMFQQR
jgi:hypothetical protein